MFNPAYKPFCLSRKKLTIAQITVTVLLLINFATAGVVRAKAQTEEPRELLPNAPVERELRRGETHFYKITLNTGVYVRISVNQKGIYVRTQLVGPDGPDDVGSYTSLTGTGLKTVSVVAATTGVYRLELRQGDDSPPHGSYEVKIDELRPATDQDRSRLEAENVETDAQSLTLPFNTAEQKRQGVAKYEEALVLWRKMGDRKSVLRVLWFLAKNHREQGDISLALVDAERAIQTAREMGDRYQEANLSLLFGIMYRSEGENQNALDSFNTARQLFKAQSAKYGEATAVSHIGATLTAVGDLEDGLRYLEEALTSISSFGDQLGECSILNNIGRIYRLQGDIQKGIEFHNRALAISRKNQTMVVEAYSLVLLASAYLELGDRQKAVDFSQQAVTVSRTLGDPLGEGDGLKLIGEATFLSGDNQKSLDPLNQALGLFRSIREREREAKTLHSLARVHLGIGNFDEARKLIELALEIQEELRSNVISQQLREAIFMSAQASFGLYIDLLMQMHRKDPSAGYDKTALQASEQERARTLLELLTESQADIRQGVPEDLLKLEHSLQQQINAKAAARTTTLSDKRTLGQAAGFDKEIAELTARYRETQVQIRRSSPHYAELTQPQPLSAAEIQQQLDDETVLIEFAPGERQSSMWAVTNSSINSYQLPASSQVEPLARKIYELLIARHPKKGETEAQYQARIAKAEAEFTTESAALSQMLLGQIAQKLQREWKSKRLAIVAPGALEYIPFAALPVPDIEPRNADKSTGDPKAAEQQPLIAAHEVINLPSASALAAIRNEAAGKKPPEKTVAVFADPVFDKNDSRLIKTANKIASRATSVRSGEPRANLSPASESRSSDLSRSLRSFNLISDRGGFSRLPYSREEAESIAALVPTSSLMKALDFQASRKTAARADLSRYGVIHFATHGLLNSEHPELSGLVLSLVNEDGSPQDGFLRLHEIYNLQLPANLIVLSACQTALGKQIKGEGLIGLTRGFMYAGAQRVVASLWQVDDLATAQLMKSFYRGMFKEGLRPAAALRAAQLETRQQKRWSSPFFWAAFTIQGEWK
jgi:tetratricopeptide (TPR) repeat protein